MIIMLESLRFTELYAFPICFTFTCNVTFDFSSEDHCELLTSRVNEYGLSQSSNAWLKIRSSQD